ncbi:hypothetical protein J7K74_00275, partial [Candidatus Woesearchaeota archaeon]|nr:hypothetical protein [Candidatus Woesearchaeota archaeon]
MKKKRWVGGVVILSLILFFFLLSIVEVNAIIIDDISKDLTIYVSQNIVRRDAFEIRGINCDDSNCEHDPLYESIRDGANFFPITNLETDYIQDCEGNAASDSWLRNYVDQRCIFFVLENDRIPTDNDDGGKLKLPIGYTFKEISNGDERNRPDDNECDTFCEKGDCDNPRDLFESDNIQLVFSATGGPICAPPKNEGEHSRWYGCKNEGDLLIYTFNGKIYVAVCREKNNNYYWTFGENGVFYERNPPASLCYNIYYKDYPTIHAQCMKENDPDFNSLDSVDRSLLDSHLGSFDIEDANNYCKGLFGEEYKCGFNSSELALEGVNETMCNNGLDDDGDGY